MNMLDIIKCKRNLSTYERLLLLVIESESPHPIQTKDLCLWAGMSRKAVEYRLKMLEEKRYITIEKRHYDENGNKLPDIYHLTKKVLEENVYIK